MYDYNSPTRINQRNRAARFRAGKPWYDIFMAARQRCENPRHPSYSRFGGAGIRFELTQDEMRVLWLRDAAEVDEPALGRLDSMGPFSFSNCKIVEKVELTRPKAKASWKDCLELARRR